METHEIEKGKNIVVVGELPFFYDPADAAVQELLKYSQQVGTGDTTVEVKLLAGAKGKKKKPK
ncbi:hypothetical protein SAMN05421788_104177 [Filimonas lacunae]|uniref:Uncharacterized protein n=1 Tax=Filimonas lacunae TaxID=477680 RepID=A0A173M969_9BACT|nr:hypothetical protein [Filimonas lacunae]BAV04087.1 hypothetical protein FLA_0066 [Filimonas lacunae]SIT15592.1 hypothetical protein SAMN05421788_104177 [Filimonas lacunae]